MSKKVDNGINTILFAKFNKKTPISAAIDDDDDTESPLINRELDHEA